MNHPYRNIPDTQRWSRSVAGLSSESIDPVMPPPFQISASSRIVTAGSCFAQHVARYLRDRGLPCFDTEPAHPLLSPELALMFNYSVYAARYGNIYTSRQLLQLWQRATGSFVPRDDRWEGKNGYFDPFRPTIQPDGFSSAREYEEDRRRHFAAVRRAFSEMDVFIFTLGLTECWASREDGAVYPLCPGVAAGTFDPGRYLLVNLSVDEVVADLRAFVTDVRTINPQMRLILTVSPVPLAATAEPRHVLVASAYSKAVLRVAAEQLCKMSGVCYFPSLEIVNAAGLAYFAQDRRTMLEYGVKQVMSLFFQHMVDPPDMAVPMANGAEKGGDGFTRRGYAIIDALCDEQRLDGHS